MPCEKKVNNHHLCICVCVCVRSNNMNNVQNKSIGVCISRIILNYYKCIAYTRIDRWLHVAGLKTYSRELTMQQNTAGCMLTMIVRCLWKIMKTIFFFFIIIIFAFGIRKRYGRPITYIHNWIIMYVGYILYSHN